MPQGFRTLSSRALWLPLLVLALSACEDIATVSIEVSKTTKSIWIDVGEEVDRALTLLVRDGTLPSKDPSTWPEEVVIEFSDREPLSVVPEPPIEIDLAKADQGGSEFAKYRNNIRSIVIDSLEYRIVENTLNYDLGPLTIAAGEEGLTTAELVELVTVEDGIPEGYQSDEDAYEDVPLTENQKNVIGSFLELDKFLVGVKAQWIGRLDRESEVPWGLIRVKVRLRATVMANPL